MLEGLVSVKCCLFKEFWFGFLLFSNSSFKNYSLGFERELGSCLLDVVLPVALYAFYLKAWFPQVFSLCGRNLPSLCAFSSDGWLGAPKTMWGLLLVLQFTHCLSQDWDLYFYVRHWKKDFPGIRYFWNLLLAWYSTVQISVSSWYVANHVHLLRWFFFWEANN